MRMIKFEDKIWGGGGHKFYAKVATAIIKVFFLLSSIELN